VGVHSLRWLFQGNTPHIAAVQNSGGWENPLLKKTHLSYRNFLLDTE
jgi:hypothetical protein